MIKKLIQMYWHEAKDKTQEHRTFKKSYARWRKHGISGMMSRLEKEYHYVKEDYVTLSALNSKYKTLMTRLVFAGAFVLSLVYFMLIKTELYESRAALIVRDLSSNSAPSGLELSLLGAGPSSQLQDSKVVEEYLQSLEVFTSLDEKFDLIQHYKSDELDPLERLASNTMQEDILEFYRTRMLTNYDEISGILHISYAHSNPETAKEILEFLIKSVEQELNEFNRRKARKQLKFILRENAKTKKRMDVSGETLERYQNEHLLLDPKNEAESTSTIIANLEGTLTQKEIELSTLRGYLNESNYEIKKVKLEIKGIKKSIKNQKGNLSGSDSSPLNKVLFEYEKLKLEFEFNTEVYKNSLIQLETTKLDVLKEAKTLSVVSKPNLPEGYSYPNKPRMFVTLLIVFFLVYGIYTMLGAIIKDHKE